MAQLSRPYQIALGVLAVLAAVWFIALRGHSGEPASSSSAPASAPSAPGVQGLAHDIQKARGTVATSQQNARQLEAKSAQVSGESAPAGVAAGKAHAATPTAPAKTGAQAKAGAAKTGAQPRTAKPIGGAAQRTAARQALVETALKEGKVAVILFWNPKGADDVVVREELELLEYVHKGARKLATNPVFRKLFDAAGVEPQKKMAVFIAKQNEVASFGTITRGVQIYGTPTMLVINKKGLVTTLTGLTDAYAIEQAVVEARKSEG